MKLTPADFPPTDFRCPRRRSGGWFAVVVAWGLAMGCLLPAAAADVAAGELVPVTMMVGFTPAAVAGGNRSDIETAFKVLCDSIGRRRGYRVTAQIRIFEDAPAFYAAIDAGEINFAVFDSLTYVEDRARGDLTPVVIPAAKAGPVRRYLLVVRRDRGWRTLEDLRGKRLVALQAPNVSVGRDWLLSLLQEKGARTFDDFFQGVESVSRASMAVLPVFFGKQDVGLVDEFGFKLMEELNPQVGAQLQTIQISEPLVGSVICVSETRWSVPQFRPDLIAVLRDLSQDPAGRQMLDLFKIDRMAPYEEGLFDSVRALSASLAKVAKEARP